MSLTIESPAFQSGETVPVKYTGDGRDASPPLQWSNVPAGTRELALICDDPDAPSADPWVHWVLYKMPPDTTGLPEHVPLSKTLAVPPGAVQGKNSWGTIGYRGPAPPKGHGQHHYHFKLYALDAVLGVGAALTKAELLVAMQGHVLAEAELVGGYEREG